MNAALEQIEPHISFALSAATHEKWRDTHNALRASLDFAELHRTPIPIEYDPASIAKNAISALEHIQYAGGHAPRLIGDVEQIAVIVRAKLRSAILQHDAALQVAIMETDGVPTIRCSIDGPGRFANQLVFGPGLSIAEADVELIWTRATRGGRIHIRPNELDLRLKGVRAVLEAPAGCETIIERLRDAEKRARILASGEFDSTDAAALRQDLIELLKSFDAQDDEPKPCDLAALIREIFGKETTPGGPVTFEFAVTRSLPPISVRRNRIVRLVGGLRSAALLALSHGGTALLELDYDQPRRAATIVFSAQGKTDAAAVPVFVSSIERTMNAHGGECEADVQNDGVTLLLSIPDEVARALDDWLPKWDTLAPRSIQMLRLLKSGGPVPPKEFILAGVLEDELERRLLPRLGVAPAATLVHDMRPRQPALHPASGERVEKVLSQLKRGRPKKEICAPPYAAEIIWLFTADERHASAIGLAHNPGKAMELCKALTGSPVDSLRALRLVIQILRPPEE